MNSLQTNSGTNINDVRSQIDGIDAQIAGLIVQRCDLSAAVARAKQLSGNTAFGWRPAREVEILRTLMRDQASLYPELAFCVWRALISANLTAQGNLTILTLVQSAVCAKEAFSVGVSPKLLATASDILEALLLDDDTIGVLPWPSDNQWWVTMMEPRFASLHVCAVSPNQGNRAEVMLVARRLPEAAGDDISLVAGPIGSIEGGIIAQCDGLELVAIGEYLDDSLTLPDGCRLIGSFALA
jgi:chorismate mutase